MQVNHLSIYKKGLDPKIPSWGPGTQLEPLQKSEWLKRLVKNLQAAQPLEAVLMKRTLNTYFLSNHFLRNHLQLFSRIERSQIELPIELRAEVIQSTIISKGTPLCVNAHPAFITFHQIDVPHFLHVACVGASTYAY